MVTRSTDYCVSGSGQTRPRSQVICNVEQVHKNWTLIDVQRPFDPTVYRITQKESQVNGLGEVDSQDSDTARRTG